MTYEKRAAAKGMTIDEIKDFLATVELLQVPGDTVVKAEVTIGGSKLKLLKVD